MWKIRLPWTRGGIPHRTGGERTTQGRGEDVKIGPGPGDGSRRAAQEIEGKSAPGIYERGP
jgi:hypothetical protein